MSIIEWDVPFSIVSPQGQLDLNTPSGSPVYILENQACQAVAPIRATKDNIPQFSGSILHKRYKTGYEIQLQVTYWESHGQIACGETAIDMHDDLMRHLESMLDADGRLLWTPTGKPVRFFDNCRWLQEVVTSVTDEVWLIVTFRLDSPFPYALDFTQNSNTFDDSDTLVNGGTATMYPVIQVYAGSSDCNGFTLTNESAIDEDGNPLQIVFDADLPGAQPIPAGEYVEIDTFRNTAYLNGDEDNMKPGIDVEETDFWGLIVGSNVITVDGDGTAPAPTVTILWANAWA